MSPRNSRRSCSMKRTRRLLRKGRELSYTCGYTFVLALAPSISGYESQSTQCRYVRLSTPCEAPRAVVGSSAGVASRPLSSAGPARRP